MGGLGARRNAECKFLQTSLFFSLVMAVLKSPEFFSENEKLLMSELLVYPYYLLFLVLENVDECRSWVVCTGSL